MTKVLVLCYSSYGHMEKMAYAAAQGAQSAGAEVSVKRVPELVPEEIAKKSGMKLEQKGGHRERRRTHAIRCHHHRRPDALRAHGLTDVELLGSSRRAVGERCTRRQGRLSDVLHSNATRWSGDDAVSGITTVLHFGLIVVGLPYVFKEQTTLDEIVGGSPYGASTIAGSKGERQPSEKELAGARYQGNHVAQIAARLTRTL